MVKIVKKIQFLAVSCFLLSFYACSLLNGSSSEVSFVEFSESKRTVYEDLGQDSMVVTQGPYSTIAGDGIFKSGGNIIDVLTAVSFVISVERPHSTGLGGGGFALLRLTSDFLNEDESSFYAVDFREKAPLKAHERIFLDEKGEVDPTLSRQGILSAGVPGLVAGVLELHEKYGELSLEAVMKPAISLARNGFPVYDELADALTRAEEKLKQFPETVEIFFRENRPLQKGDILVQEDLAKTLELISQYGQEVFYKGEIADKLISYSDRYQGLFTHEDFENYNVIWREPVVGTYKGLEIISMPPPSSGGAHIIQILNILENDDLGSRGPFNPHNIHLTASAMQQAFADRAKHMGDADFVDVPLEEIISKKYARKIRSEISSDRVKKAEDILPLELDFEESEHTIHFTIADGEGNIVSTTQTINGYFGSGMVAGDTGIILNNEMDDFAAKAGASNIFGAIGGSQNLVGPEKRPLSSMSPTIVIDQDTRRPLLALGSPSGTRILTCVANTILNFFEYEMGLFDSVMAVRYHHQWRPDSLRVDLPGFPAHVKKELEKKGYEIDERSFSCRVQAISFNEDGSLHGVSDMRGKGMSLGN